jgi:hypothetical protein
MKKIQVLNRLVEISNEIIKAGLFSAEAKELKKEEAELRGQYGF